MRDTMPSLYEQSVFERFDRVYRTGESIDAPEFEAQVDRGDTGLTRCVY